MILIDNRNVLRFKDRELLTRLTEFENSSQTGNVIVEQSKTGVPTLRKSIDGRFQYLHSKYDPEKDAERFVSKFENENYKHVLFVGSGLGYHIQKFTETYSNVKFSIYEPDEEVLITYLGNQKLDRLPIKNLVKIFTGTDQTRIKSEIQTLLRISNGILKIIILPVYEKMYSEQIDWIMKEVVVSLKDKKFSLVTNLSFQKRWTINSIKNFPKVLKTPNILQDIDKSAFKGKPAIIVAAGPSLNEEFENLRYIKENGLAYIFSVGSAINALIEHGIYPDAACTYDPQSHNEQVIKIIKDKKIEDITLIFGSSVGFETLKDYPGKMLHMIVNQDTISPLLLQHSNNEVIDYINDAPSIAVITFQLLSKLGFNKVILVGQNLAYVNNQNYAKGIDYGNGADKVSKEILDKANSVQSVEGKELKTNDAFDLMRQQLEMYISFNPHLNVINTTKGGAEIKGTEFIPLEKVILEILINKTTDSNWNSGKNEYNLNIMSEKKIVLIKASKELENQINSCFNELKIIYQSAETNQKKDMEKKFIKLDREMDRMKNNIFYNGFIEPMVKVQYQQLVENNLTYRFEKDSIKKANAVVQAFGSFLEQCAAHYQFVLPYFDEMNERIEEIVNGKFK